MIAQPAYKRPPITEAVIDVVVEGQASEGLVEKASDALRSRYPGVQKLVAQQWTVTAGPGAGPAHLTVHPASFRRATQDQTEIVIVAPNRVSVAQLPDYPGWETFSERFRRDWTTIKKVLGYRKIIRLGVRYINRIDVPLNDNGSFNIDDYLAIAVQAPVELHPFYAYGLQAQFGLPSIDGAIVINSGVIPSPVPRHESLLLDLDLFREHDLPQRDEELFALLDSFRVEKNRVFELAITPKARELFDR